jgi:hypothetical protein
MAKGLDYVINLANGDFGGVDKAKTKLGEVENAIDGASKKSNVFANGLGKVGALIGGAFALSEIVAFGKESVSAAQATRSAAAQAAVGIETTAGAAGKSLKELREQAENLENTTLFGDEQTLGAQSLLLTFTGIKGKIFDEAIPAIQDMAQRLAGEGPADLKGASIQVGKALNDPIQGMNALRRVGVSFTETQKQQIKYMQEHNNLAGAQKLILAELNKEFGGSAVAARKAAGPMADWNVWLDNTKKSIGNLILDGIQKIPIALEATKQFISDHETGLKAIGVVLGVVATGALLYGGYLVALAAPLAITNSLTWLQVTAQWALNAAMDANPVGLVIAGVALLAGGLYYAYQKSETFRAGLNGLMEIGKSLGDVFLGLGKTIVGALTFNPKMIAEGAAQAAKAVGNISDKGGLGGIFNKGYDSSIAETRASEKAKAKEDKQKEAAAPMIGKAHVPDYLPSDKELKELKKSKTTKVGNESVAGGKSVKNITINIQSLIKEFSQHVNNLRGTDAYELKRLVSETLLSAVRDVEIMAE